MKTFKKIMMWALAIVLILILVAYVLPKIYKVERSVYIKARPDLIYDLTSNFKKWKLWEPWTKAIDSTAVYVLIGKEGQVGSIWKWDGKILGNGQMTATGFIPGQQFAYDLEFNKGNTVPREKLQLKRPATHAKFHGLMKDTWDTTR